MKPLFVLFVAFFAVSAKAQEKSYHLDKDYTMSPTGTLKLKCSDAQVFIKGSNRTSAHVKIDRVVETKGITFGGKEEFSVEVREVNGDLEVEERHFYSQTGIIGYHNEKYTIRIELPMGASLNVKGDDGDYLLKDINGAITLSLDDADVEMTGCSGSDFDFRLDDGDIVMDQGKGRLTINSDDADVRIQRASFTSIDADTDDGDLIIETSLSDTGVYRISAQDGLVALTVTQGGGRFEIHHDDARVITEGGFEEVEHSENHTSLTLANGKARVDIRSDDARVRLARR